MIFLFFLRIANAAAHQASRCLDEIYCKAVSIKIDYPGSGNKSEFVYDGGSRNTKIVETVGGSITETRQFVWCSEERCESRDGSGVPSEQFFDYGQVTLPSNLYYSVDDLGSIWQVADSRGTPQAQYSYDSYGRSTAVTGSAVSSFRYAGYYHHQSSGLNLTRYRAYDANFGRWLNRDPIEELGGVNLYAYVGNDPLSFNDPSGLDIGTGGGSYTPPTTTTEAPSRSKHKDPDPKKTRKKGHNRGGKPQHGGGKKPPVDCDSHRRRRKCDPPVPVPGRWPETYSECQIWCFLSCEPEDVQQCEEKCRIKGYKGPSLEEIFEPGE